jgi:Uma2 family endonuclease
VSKSKVTEPAFVRFSELWNALGQVPPERIRMQPPPGTATEEDVIAICESKFGRLCELIDHTLVEKTVGFYESRVAVVLARSLDEFAEAHKFGFVIGEGGMLRVEPEQVRLPDVAFFSWEHFPGQVLPDGQIRDQVPDLAVGVLSPNNTRAEMERKRREKFLRGCRLVWEIDPVKKTARVYTAPDESKLVREKGKLNGGDVLPEFELSLAQLFERAGQRRRA